MKRILVVSASVVIIITILLSIGLVGLKIYADNNINYDIDEALFQAAKDSNTATYLAYNSAGELEEVWKDSSGGRKSWTDIELISPLLKDGFVAVEDGKFYQHKGVNLKRTLAAVANYIVRIKPNFGASTITQQVIKNISGDNDYSIKRKLTEILRAVHLEMAHSKEEILELYLNIVPMSGNLYGVREASLSYFGKEPSDVTVAEAATLIGITNSPARYNPYTKVEECTEKRNTVLGVMLEHEVISEEEYQAAKAEPLITVDEDISFDRISSWFVETAQSDIISDLCSKFSISENAAKLLLNSGTKIILTMNSTVQRIMEEFFENEENLSVNFGEGLQYSMVVSDSATGNLLGVIGRAGKKEGNKLLNLATALHTPGSTLKPLALYAPLIENDKITWSTMVDDAPSSYSETNGEIVYYPKNSPDVYEGRMTISDALRLSKNTVALELYGMLGAEAIYRNLTNNYGFSSLVEREVISNGSVLTDKAASPLALGQLTRGVNLRELTEAYTAFPGGGVLRRSKSYYGVFDSEGKVLLDNVRSEKRIFSESTANVMNMMLSRVVEDGTARSITLKHLVDTAGKTGTSGMDRDRLFVGYTPYYTAGIWCGYADGKTSIGAQSPSHIKIWDSVMKEIHEQTVFKASDESIKGFSDRGITRALYCKETGLHAIGGCISSGTAEYGYFKSSELPKERCGVHREEE